ncbi:hypothetical protein HED60_16100 [Planctomycetales bacterium ZRK34]|nr:hypothetical protein HED60_16100 [Planctomycetales bacterium ZRK34]
MTRSFAGSLGMAAIAAIVLSFCGSARANMVLNPSFEDFTNSDPTDADVWNNHVFPTNQARTNERDHLGDNSLKIFTAPDGGGSSDIRQDVYVTPDTWGKPYKFTIYVYNPTGEETLDTMGYFTYLRPRKSDSTIIFTQTTPLINSSSPTGVWIQQTLTGIVPVDTQRFLIQLNATNLLSADAQAVFIDDVSFVVLPTPAALPAGLGLLGMMLMRRR